MQTRGAFFAADEWRKYGAIIPACLAGVMLMAVHNYTLGVMIHPLEMEYGWTRAEISIGPMIPSLAAILMAPLVGLAIDRYGPRRIALFGVPFFTASLALLSTATSNILTWWALYSLLGVASMFVFPMVWTAAINARFDRNRGLALAIALTGTGISATIMPLLATWLTELQGWRGAYVCIALLCFAVVFPLVLFTFARTAPPTRAARAPATALETRSAVRAVMLSARYIKLASAVGIFSLAVCALTANAVPILLSEGFTAISAAAMAGLVGLGSITGRLCGGVLLDRFDGRYVAAGSVIAPGISVIILLTTQGSQTGASIACFLIGLAGGTEYDACAYLASRHFKMRHFGTLFGLISGIILLANGIAPTLANHVYDVTKSYDLVLWALFPLFILSAILFLLLGAYPETDAEDVVLEAPEAIPATV